jgi:hypothetical protein
MVSESAVVIRLHPMSANAAATISEEFSHVGTLQGAVAMPGSISNSDADRPARWTSTYKSQ